MRRRCIWGLKYQPLKWLSLDLSGWTRVARGGGHMKDYDWADQDRANWSQLLLSSGYAGDQSLASGFCWHRLGAQA